MSYTDHAAARRVKGLRGTARAVFLELAALTSNDGLHQCRVKVATLGAAVGKADHAIRFAIQELRGVGLIATQRRYRKNGAPTCFRFELLMPFPACVTVPKRIKTPNGSTKPAVKSTVLPAVKSTALLIQVSSSDPGSIGLKTATVPVAVSTSPSIPTETEDSYPHCAAPLPQISIPDQTSISSAASDAANCTAVPITPLKVWGRWNAKIEHCYGKQHVQAGTSKRLGRMSQLIKMHYDEQTWSGGTVLVDLVVLLDHVVENWIGFYKFQKEQGLLHSDLPDYPDFERMTNQRLALAYQFWRKSIKPDTSDGPKPFTGSPQLKAMA